MKIVAIVPIKMNNERLPGKNTKEFDDGTPLIQLCLQNLVQVKEIDESYIYCSNGSIVDYLIPGVKFLRRHENLDLNTAKINDIIGAFINDINADIYVLVHATAPFLKAETIKNTIKSLFVEGGSKFDSAFTVKKLQEFLWKDNHPMNYNLDKIPRTQDLELYYMETSGCYAFRREVFLNKKTRIGERPCLIPVSEVEAVDINNPLDFEIANAIYMKKLHEL